MVTLNSAEICRPPGAAPSIRTSPTYPPETPTGHPRSLPAPIVTVVGTNAAAASFMWLTTKAVTAPAATLIASHAGPTAASSATSTPTTTESPTSGNKTMLCAPLRTCFQRATRWPVAFGAIPTVGAFIQVQHTPATAASRVCPGQHLHHSGVQIRVADWHTSPERHSHRRFVLPRRRATTTTKTQHGRRRCCRSAPLPRPPCPHPRARDKHRRSHLLRVIFRQHRAERHPSTNTKCTHLLSSLAVDSRRAPLLARATAASFSNRRRTLRPHSPPPPAHRTCCCPANPQSPPRQLVSRLQVGGASSLAPRPPKTSDRTARAAVSGTVGVGG